MQDANVIHQQEESDEVRRKSTNATETAEKIQQLESNATLDLTKHQLGA